MTSTLCVWKHADKLTPAGRATDLRESESESTANPRLTSSCSSGDRHANALHRFNHDASSIQFILIRMHNGAAAAVGGVSATAAAAASCAQLFGKLDDSTDSRQARARLRCKTCAKLESARGFPFPLPPATRPPRPKRVECRIKRSTAACGRSYGQRIGLSRAGWTRRAAQPQRERPRSSDDSD